MKQLESGLVSKKLSKNESTLLTQIQLDANQAFMEDMITFNHNLESVTIASTAPGPLLVLNQTKRDNLLIQQELIQTNNIAELLLDRKYTCIVTNQPLNDRRINTIISWPNSFQSSTSLLFSIFISKSS